MVEKFLEQSHLQKPEEEDKPVKDTFYVDGGMGKRADALKRLVNTKLGDTVMFNGKKGTVVAKSGTYMTIASEGKTYSTHVNDTYLEGDIMSKLWTQMLTEARQSILMKAKLPIKYAERSWFDLPQIAKEVIKSGFAGREEGVTREDESESFRDAINPKHVNKPVNEEKKKSDVEYGAYGGVTTRTYIDATDEYEDDGVRAKKPLSGPSGKVRVHDPVEGTRYKAEDEEEEEEIKTKDNGGAGNDPGGLLTTTTAETDNKKESKEKAVPTQEISRYGIRYGMTQKDLDKLAKKKDILETLK